MTAPARTWKRPSIATPTIRWPILLWALLTICSPAGTMPPGPCSAVWRSEEHRSELQSRFDLVCRLLLEKKKIKPDDTYRQLNHHRRPPEAGNTRCHNRANN